MRETWNTPTIEELDTKLTANSIGFGGSEDVWIMGLAEAIANLDGEITDSEQNILDLIASMVVSGS